MKERESNNTNTNENVEECGQGKHASTNTNTGEDGNDNGKNGIEEMGDGATKTRKDIAFACGRCERFKPSETADVRILKKRIKAAYKLFRRYDRMILQWTKQVEENATRADDWLVRQERLIERARAHTADIQDYTKRLVEMDKSISYGWVVCFTRLALEGAVILLYTYVRS